MDKDFRERFSNKLRKTLWNLKGIQNIQEAARQMTPKTYLISRHNPHDHLGLDIISTVLLLVNFVVLGFQNLGDLFLVIIQVQNLAPNSITRGHDILDADCSSSWIFVIRIRHGLLHDRFSLGQFLFVALVQGKVFERTWRIGRQDRSMSMRFVVIFFGFRGRPDGGHHQQKSDNSSTWCHCSKENRKRSYLVRNREKPKMPISIILRLHSILTETWWCWWGRCLLLTVVSNQSWCRRLRIFVR